MGREARGGEDQDAVARMGGARALRRKAMTAWMVVASVTTARMESRPPQRTQARTSASKVRRSRTAHSILPRGA